MRFTTILAVHIGAAVGFVAARQLLSPETDLQRLPDGVRTPLAAARSRLQRATARVAVALNEAGAERAEAESELRREYAQATATRK
jgi:hypothetical protein